MADRAVNGISVRHVSSMKRTQWKPQVLLVRFWSCCLLKVQRPCEDFSHILRIDKGFRCVLRHTYILVITLMGIIFS